MPIEITTLSAPELDVYARLTEVQLRNRQDPAKGIFIAESATAVNLALDAGYEPISLLIERRQLSGEGGKIARRCEGIPVYTAQDSLLSALTGFHLTRGVLCAMRRPALPSVEECLANARRVALLEDIADSTNVGAIFRSAAALSVDAVLITPGCCDPLCRRSIRVSMGTVFQVPWTKIRTDNRDWQEHGMDTLHSLGFRTAAMALSPQAISIADPRPRQEPKLAILLGSEGSGLSPNTLQRCDYILKIPMSHGVDSLNVAAASAVAFWQLNYEKGGHSVPFTERKTQ